MKSASDEAEAESVEVDAPDVENPTPRPSGIPSLKPSASVPPTKNANAGERDSRVSSSSTQEGTFSESSQTPLGIPSSVGNSE